MQTGHFIDFIRISQEFPVQRDAETGEVQLLPKVDSGFIAKYVRNDETGDVTLDYQSTSRRMFEGSYDSLYIVRCDGVKVEFEGNVGRFARPDNLFNFDFDGTIQRINEILAGLGLPAFSAGVRYQNPNPSKYDIQHGIISLWDGATVSELHITRNYETGSPGNAQAAIDWLATQSVSHVKRTRSFDTTVSWGRKSGRKLLKAYLKAPEMLVHRHGRSSEEILQDPVYQYAQTSGILRFELEAKRLLLRDNHCRYLGDITMSKLVRLFESEVDPLLSRVKEDITRLELETLPNAVRMTAAAYLRGECVSALLSRATFYRHAKILRHYGIDISEQLANVKPFTTVIKVVEIKPVTQVPSWYWEHQRLMTLKAVGDYDDGTARTTAQLASAEPKEYANHAMCDIKPAINEWRNLANPCPVPRVTGSVSRLSVVN